MALVPLAVDELERLISSSGKPTGPQYATYWGRTAKERYGRLVESLTVSFLGVFFSYFLSFVLGGFVATILGCLFFFWGVLSPELKAYQRNWEFLGGRPLVDVETVLAEGADPEAAGLYGGLFLGRVADACVVEDAQDDVEYDLADFWDYTMYVRTGPTAATGFNLGLLLCCGSGLLVKSSILCHLSPCALSNLLSFTPYLLEHILLPHLQGIGRAGPVHGTTVPAAIAVRGSAGAGAADSLPPV